MRTLLLRLVPAALIFTAASSAYAVMPVTPVACTMDAKLCPDGETYVGRDGSNNCEWEKCPGETDAVNHICDSYVCSDGTLVDKCDAQGNMLNYFAAPCHMNGGEAGAPFEDVQSNHPNADAIVYVKAEGIVEGYEDGEFKPDNTINRAEFMKILAGVNHILIDERMESDPNARPWEDSVCIAILNGALPMPFSDVSKDAWYGPAVCHGYSQVLIEGYNDGTFRPEANINFAEAAKILANTFDIAAPGMALGHDWYKPYVVGLEKKNSIPTSVSRFDQNITRGEMAEMIYRLKTGNNDKSSRTYEDLSGPTQLVMHADFRFSTQKEAITELGYLQKQIIVRGDDVNFAISINDNLDTTFDETWLFLGELQGKPSRMIGGEASYAFVSGDLGYCDGPGCSGPYVAYAIVHEGRVYTFQFWNDKVLSADERLVLDSFTFRS